MRLHPKRALAPRLLCALMAAAGLVSPAWAETRHYSFGYDQPHTTGFGVAGDIFADSLAKSSGGTMLIDQFPGAQLGQEPQALQKIRTGDIDFLITSTANAATLAPESGVMSLHYLFQSESHLTRSLADPAITAAMKAMFDQNVTGVHMLGLATLGLRDLYGKNEVHSIADIKGRKIRVQATPTEDAIFPAYGAQTVHMPFGSVYTSLQTGVVDMAENGINVYQANKHYEVAPVMSLTGHEANNSVLWVSDKVWSSLSDEQRRWVQDAADTVSKTQPARALALEHDSEAKLRKLGIKFIPVDTSGFVAIATPVQDSSAKELGPNAVKILALIRADKDPQ